MHSQLLYGAGMNRMVGVAEQKLKQLEIIDRKHNRLSKDRLFLTRVEDEHKLCKIEAQTYHITMFEEKFSLSDEPLYIISSESIVNTPVYEEKRPLLGGEKTTGNNGGTTNDDTAYDDFYDEKSPADQQERDSLAQVNTTDNVSIEYSGNSSSMTQSSPDVPRESKSTVSSQSLTSPAEPEAHARANRALSQPALHHTQTHLAMKSEGHHLLFQAQALSLPLTQRQPVIRVAPYNYMIVTMQRTYGVIVDKHSTTNAAIDAFEEYLHRHAVFRIAAAPMLINDMMKNPDDIAVYTQKTADGIKSGTIAVADVIVRGSVYLGYLMRRGSAFIKRQINPSNEPIEVSEATHHRIASVRAYSQKVSDTSEAVVSGALKTCRIVGNKIGSALTSGSGADDAIAAQGPRRDAAKDMVRSILAVPVEIYNALETASMNVVNDVADNTVDILRYRYGDEYGEAAQESAGIVTDVTGVIVKTNRLHVSSFVMGTIESTGVSISSDGEKRKNLLDKGLGLREYDMKSGAFNGVSDRKIRLEKEVLNGVNDGCGNSNDNGNGDGDRDCGKRGKGNEESDSGGGESNGNSTDDVYDGKDNAGGTDEEKEEVKAVSSREENNDIKTTIDVNDSPNDGDKRKDSNAEGKDDEMSPNGKRPSPIHRPFSFTIGDDDYDLRDGEADDGDATTDTPDGGVDESYDDVDLSFGTSTLE